jgi:hypothetical protein
VTPLLERCDTTVILRDARLDGLTFRLRPLARFAAPSVRSSTTPIDAGDSRDAALIWDRAWSQGRQESVKSVV